MKIWRVLLVGVAFILLPSLLGCGLGKAEVDQLIANYDEQIESLEEQLQIELDNASSIRAEYEERIQTLTEEKEQKIKQYEEQIQALTEEVNQLQTELKKLESAQEYQAPYQPTYTINQVIQQVKKHPEAQSMYDFMKIPAPKPLIRYVDWTASYAGNGEWIARVTYDLWEDWDEVEGDIWQKYILEFRFNEITRETEFIEYREY